MRMLISLAALLALAPAAATPPERMYLLSITAAGLKPGDAISGFKLESWGVRYRAVCEIPPGWTIRAGGSATPEGWLEGASSHGATWLRRSDIAELDGLVLVTLDQPPVWHAMRDRRGDIVIPATLSGVIELADPNSETPRTLTVGAANFRFIPARACPAP